MKSLISVFIMVLCLNATAQKFAPLDKSVMDVAYFPNGAHRQHMSKTPEDKAKVAPKIKITYSRPLAAGRKVFGDLVKLDQTWRFGANESTELALYVDAKIGNVTLKPGRYTLYCTPSADKWTLRVHPNVDGWGSFGFDETKDLTTVSAATQKLETTLEAFSITMYEASPKNVMLKAGWENTVVEFPITLL